MKVFFLLSLAVCVAVTMAMPSKVSTTFNDNFPLLKDELCNNQDYRTDNYHLFGQLVYLLLTLPNEENYLENNCRKYLSISKNALIIFHRLKNIDSTNYDKFESHPKRTLDSIGALFLYFWTKSYLEKCTYQNYLTFYLYKAGFKNANPDNIGIRNLVDLDNKIRSCIFSNSVDNFLCALQNRCAPSKCDLKKLLWYAMNSNENLASAFMDDNGWNNNKIKKNFDEIDKTSASFSTLNQLI